MNYYQRLRDTREDRGFLQKDIANVLGIRQSDYSKYERGINMMGIDKYITLAIFYNVSLDHLCGLINEKKADKDAHEEEQQEMKCSTRGQQER